MERKLTQDSQELCWWQRIPLAAHYHCLVEITSEHTIYIAEHIFSHIPHILATRVPMNCLHKIFEQVAPERWMPLRQTAERDDKTDAEIT